MLSGEAELLALT